MSYYAGIDISNQESKICIMDKEGNIVREESVDSDANTIINFFIHSGFNIVKIGLESGMLSRWLTQELNKAGLPAFCICSRVMHSLISVSLNKNDRNDAREIADAMRFGKYREVHIKSSVSVEICTLLNSRSTLVNQRKDLNNTIRGLLKGYGIRCKSFSATNVIEVLDEHLKKIPYSSKSSLLTLISVMKEIDSHIKELDKRVKEEAAKFGEVKLFQTIFGIGPITALQFFAEVDNPNRFSDPRDVGAYFGLTPREFSSGERVSFGKISRFGSSTMRSLLYEAAIVLLTRSGDKWSSLKAWGMKLKKKKGIKRAAVAVARKLAIIMFMMWKTGEEFKYQNPKKQKKRLKVA